MATLSSLIYVAGAFFAGGFVGAQVVSHRQPTASRAAPSDKRYAQADRIPELLHELIGLDDPAQQFTNMVKTLKGQFGGDYSAVLTPDKNGKQLSVRASLGLTDEGHGLLKISTRSGLASYLHQKRRPLQLTATDRDFASFAKLTEPVGRCLVASLHDGKQLLGAAWVGRREEEPPYVRSELELFGFMALVYSQALALREQFQSRDLKLEQLLRRLIEQKESRSPMYEGHSQRVAELATKMARFLKWPEERVTSVEKAAWLHDLGQLSLSNELLDKAERFDTKDRQILESCPDRAVEMLKPFACFNSLLSILRHHHERPDGSGYPVKLKGSAIPGEAGLIGLAEAYDALTHKRPYRAAMSSSQALEQLHSDRFDPAHLKALGSVLGERSAVAESGDDQPKITLT